MRGRARSMAVCSAAIAIVIAACASVAQAEWLPPVDVSEPGEHAGSPHVVLDSEGNATAVWDRWNGADTVIEAAYRPAGESWEAPVDLSEPELVGEVVPGEHDAQSPQIVVDRNSNVTVIWERYAGSKMILQSVDRPAGGSWTAPVDIAEMNQGFAPEPWIAVDWEGNATAVWKQGEVIHTAFRTFLGDWGEPIAISGAESFVPQAAMDAGGNVTAVWMHDDGAHYVVESAYKPERGAWESPTVVSQPGEEAGNPHVALDAKGDALVVWRRPGGSDEVVRAAYRPKGGSWSLPTNVSSEGEGVESLRDAVDPEGNAIVAWAGNSKEIGGHDIVHAAFKPVGGDWAAPTELSADGGNAFPSDVVFDTSGNAALVWQRWDGTSNIVQAAYRPAGEEWEAPVDLSEEGKRGMDAVVVLDAPGEATTADGNATAVWVSEEDIACPGKESCRSDTVQAAGYDPKGPLEVELEAPEAAEVGEPVQISTPTEEVFAPLIEFGDGKSAAATQAVHIYDEPGEYEVAIGGAEVLGYRSSARQTIAILPAGPEEPKPEIESELPGLGTTDADGAPPVSPGADPPSGDPSPSAQCLGAEAAHDAALHRLRLIGAKLGRAHGASEAHRLATAKRRQAMALRRASRRVASAC